MILQRPENAKLLRSALIAIGGVGFLLLIRFVFPDQDMTVYEAGLAVAVGSWVVNAMKESLKL